MQEPAAANSYEQERREKVRKLREMGVDPYGQRTEGIVPLSAIRAQHKAEFGQAGGPVVKAAGRIIFCKRFGKLSFITLRDESGDLQVALDKKRLPERDWAAGEQIDLGDQIVVTGPLGATKTGEVTVWGTELAFAAKSLLSPPAKWEGLSDVELRYRQRYVDLWANPEVMRILKMRIRIVEEIRAYMKGLGYVEVETPMMQPLAGGAAARPFETHHNALDIPLYMRIAPELYLKRLLVGGFAKIFELNRNFRNEGISPRHNPEFTMLEAYEAYGSWETMAEMVEGMICHVAEKLFGGLRIVHGGNATTESTESTEGTEKTEKVIDLSRPWPRIRMVDLVERETGWKFTKQRFQSLPQEVQSQIILNFRRAFESQIRGKTEALRKKNEVAGESFGRQPYEGLLTGMVDAAVGALISRFDEQGAQEQLVEVYEKLIEPTLINPCFVTRVPSVIIPLARPAEDDDYFADVYELAINGQEISPGYTELNDPDVQAKQFGEQVGDEAERQKIDHDFLNALKYGMPPAGGMGMGIDRLVMMLTGAESIRDVILFPLMKPQQHID